MYKLPESDDMAFCFACDGLINLQDYDQYFVPGLEEIIQKRGAIYMVVWFKNYEGWDEGAMLSDLETHMKYGPEVARIAFINAPENFRLKMNVMEDHTAGEVRYYGDEDYEKAVNWVKHGDEDAGAAAG